MKKPQKPQNRPPRSLLAPQEVRLNRNTNLLKCIAMAAMLCDHMGVALFPHMTILRQIGRLAFPIYCYCLAVGCVYTKNMARYIERLLLLALISQPLYVEALHHQNSAMYLYSFQAQPVQAALQYYKASWQTPSIYLALTLGALIIWSLRDKKFVITVSLAVLVWLIERKYMAYSYGWKGIVLMVLFYLFIDMPLLSFPLVATFMFWWGHQGGGYVIGGMRFGVQLFAILALPLIYIPMRANFHMNRWIFYFFYPAHLILILLLSKIL